jgi:hypothetical protein
MCWIELGWRCGVGLERTGSTNKPADAIPSGSGPSDTNSQPNSSPVRSIARAFRDAASRTSCERSTNASRVARRSGITEDRSTGTARSLRLHSYNGRLPATFGLTWVGDDRVSSPMGL